MDANGGGVDANNPDGISRRNFACFGDVMSFDATYRTNKYKLVFVPFTGVDNHKRCITFGAGLIAQENTDSYEWLLTSFKTAMGATPRCAITDEDPTLKVAVPKINRDPVQACVLKNEGLDEIPGKYILNRWTRDACTRPMHEIWWTTNQNTQVENEVRSIANQLWNEFYNCMGLANGWQEKMEEMLTTLQQLKKDFKNATHQPPRSHPREMVIESILGSKPTGEIHIKPPKVAKNKGHGKRLKSNKEKAILKKGKKPRACATCGGLGHDSRNCEENKTDEED
nr:protein FAR1-RELATED SEQUENCE 5-like [Ipomoea batatas]